MDSVTTLRADGTIQLSARRISLTADAGIRQLYQGSQRDRFVIEARSLARDAFCLLDGARLEIDAAFPPAIPQRSRVLHAQEKEPPG